jgi:hypothetical protein
MEGKGKGFDLQMKLVVIALAGNTLRTYAKMQKTNLKVHHP